MVALTILSIIFLPSLASASSAPTSQTITTGSQIAGTFPTDIATVNNVFMQYREASVASFPAINTRTFGADAAGLSHTITLPTAIPIGTLLIVGFAANTPGTVTWPVGWTQFDSIGTGGCCGDDLYMGYRFPDGSEGPTIAITT